MIKGAVLLLLGLAQIIWMIWAIRSRAAETRISVVEAAILRAADAEPLPKTRLGVAVDRLQHWLGLLLGIVMACLGTAILIG